MLSINYRDFEHNTYNADALVCDLNRCPFYLYVESKVSTTYKIYTPPPPPNLHNKQKLKSKQKFLNLIEAIYGKEI